ncbi:hypothetical protein [Chloroflexus sp.]|uniref:hypothetical protein n=1 Tax=Chloroflexus sp. TaxID=1904827 RepID=UPI002ACDD694|nr:hypothetical protein [Chloroflexus sp.]
MRQPAIITFLAAVFFGGAMSGLVLTSALTPDSHLLRWFDLGALPLVFVTGAFRWLVIAFGRGIVHTFRQRKLPAFAGDQAIPPGATAFVFTSTGIMALVGVLVAMAPNRFGFWPTLVLCIGTGAGYGLLCQYLAHRGYLPVYDLESER